MLAAIGVAVYWKFDSVVSSQVFRNLLKPSGLMRTLFPGDQEAEFPPSPAIAENWRWSTDSSYLEATCDSPGYRDCQESWKGMAGSDIGELRALIAKARTQWSIEPDGGFTARFRRLESGKVAETGILPGLELERLDMITPKGTVSLSRASDGRSFCANGKCLDELHPRPPFSEFLSASKPANPEWRESHPIEAVLTPLQSPVFRPVLDGRIVDASPLADTIGSVAAPVVDSNGASHPANWVKLYHGRNLFSMYRGFARLSDGLRPGSMVRAGDILGFVAARGDSLGALGIRIEKDGLAMDPFAFLGLGADSAESGR